VQIDPKRAIPRDEQDKTSKIFVGGIGQDVVEEEFKEYFEQFGTVLDATLMMDKETGRPRGFGFVTFDDDGAVENCMAHSPLYLKQKMVNPLYVAMVDTSD
jgi:RNA-binding protein Musashi